MAVTPLCTRANVESIYGKLGVVGASDDNQDESPDGTFIADAIERASVTVYDYLLPRGFTVAQLTANSWVKWCASYLVICELTQRRGNPSPEVYSTKCADYIVRLEAIAAGQKNLPADDGSMIGGSDSSPCVSNMTPDLRFHRGKIRRVPSTSTGGPQTEGRKQLDAPDINLGGV